MIDLAYLTAMMDGDERLAHKFFEIFQKQAPQQIKDLRLQYNSRDWEAFSNTAHSLKSQFSYLNLTSFAEQMSMLEHLADEKLMDNIENMLQQTEENFYIFFTQHLLPSGSMH